MNARSGMRLDASAAWNAWTSSGSPEAAAEFFDRVGAWTDGTAAQLTRSAPRHIQRRPTRDEVASQLRHELGRLAGGEPVAYLVALNAARRNVIADLHSPRPV